MSRLSSSPHLIQQQLSGAPSSHPQDQLPPWLLNLPGVSRVVQRIGLTEFRRRLFHMSPALLPVGLPLIPHQDTWGPILMSLLLIMTVVSLLIAIVLGPILMRKNESTWMFAVLGYMLPVVGALLAFPGRAEWGLMTLQILALGDGSATLGGMMIGGPRLPWNRSKTLSGLACFTVAGSLAATYSFWGEARPGVAVGTAFLICFAAAVCAGIVESLPIRSNDNLRVGVTALLVGVAMTLLLV